MHTRRYTAFISYRHADNTQEGRRWAEWLHRALERYTVPPDLIGTPNLRGDPIRDSLYPIFRDEDELPANADLATGIRAALEVSDHLIVLCSPRSAVSPWVRKEVREFKELGRSDRILAIIIAGEPNADDPAKARDGILRDEECFCEELRFGAVRDDGTLDWTIRTEPLAADLRPSGTRAEGFVTAEAYREHLTLNSSLTREKIITRTEAYRQQLDHGILKVAAGLLGVPLGQLIDRDAAHRAELARIELERSKAEALRLRIFSRRLALVGGAALVLALLAGWFWWRSGKEKAEADQQRISAVIALAESDRQLERSQVEEGRAWLERGRGALNRGDHLSALMLAGRAIGYQSYGRVAQESRSFCNAYPLLLARPMRDATTEKERADEARGVTEFIHSIRSTLLPLWVTTMSDEVMCVAFSPDGAHLAGGSVDETIKLWDAVTGKELTTINGRGFAFSADGTRLACGFGENNIKLWDVVARREVAIFKGHAKSVCCVAFSPDGTRLASGSADKTIKIWDTVSGKELATLQGHDYGVDGVAFSPDGVRLASHSIETAIKLWDVNTSREIAAFQGHAMSVWSIAFSRDGSRLASGSADKTIKIWDSSSGRELASLLGHDYGVAGIAFSPDGSRISSSSADATRDSPSGSIDNMIKLWDTATGKELASLQGHRGVVFSVAFSPDGSRLVSASGDKTIKLWDAAGYNEFVTLEGHVNHVTCVAFSSDGSRLATRSSSEIITLWDAASGKELAKLQEMGRFTKGTGSYKSCLAFSPNGSLLACGFHNGTIRRWDTSTGRELASIKAHMNWVTHIAFNHDGTRLASCSKDNSIKLWDAASGNELASVNSTELGAAKQWLTATEVRLSPNKNRIAEIRGNCVFIVPNISPTLDLTAPLRGGLIAFQGREIQFPEIKQPIPILHVRQDTLAQLANPKLTPERRAELRMELCTKSSQFRAATALWQRMLQGEWPGFEGATVPKDQAPATIPADSAIRRLYLLALIDATKHPQIHGHPTICQTTAQIAPVLTKEMMATPTISLAMMSLMQTLAKDDSPDMTAPRAVLMKRLEEVASKDWLAVLRENTDQ